jgi:heterodisulfide reductase subunit B2
MSVEVSTGLAERIQRATGENVYMCYQCVKCTSGCPMMNFFDMAPNQVMRAAQLGLEKEVFDARTPWMCASCQTCSTRCPQGVDIARVMDFIVSEAVERGIPAKVPEVALFNKVFLRDVKLLGRLFDLGLMAEVDLRNWSIVRDIPLALALLRKGAIHPIPEVRRVRFHPHAEQAPVRAESEIGYYPGCSLHGIASAFDVSARAVMESFGFTPIEPKGWVCCGSTPAHRLDERMAVRLPMINMQLLDQQGFREAALPCASCFSRFRVALHEWRTRPETRERIDLEMGEPYPDRVEVRSLLDFVIQRVGIDRVEGEVTQPLHGLKVACYYGCLLTRPPKVTGSVDYEYPHGMDRLMQAIGAEPVEWDMKVACCGGSLAMTRTEVVLELGKKIVDNARERGAQAIVVACPLCESNLQARQEQMHVEPRMPIIYFTQLMAVALGRQKDAALGHNLIDPRPLVNAALGSAG